MAPALAPPVDRVEVRLLDLLRHGARRPDELVVDLADRRHLGGRADHENLVGEIEVGADDRLLDDAMPEVLGDLDHRVAGDPHENRG